MKKLLFVLVAFLPLFAIGQVSITKVGDQIKFTGLGIGNGVVTNSKAYDAIYSSSVDQIMVQGTNVYFISTASRGIVATVPWAKITSKLGQSTPAAYVEKLIALGYLSKTAAEEIETVYSGNNVAQGVRYLPDTTGLLMDGYHNLTISGYIVEGQAVNDSIMLQVKNSIGEGWQTIYGYSWKTNTSINQLKQTGAGTLSVAWSFPTLNFQRYRLIAGFADSTNIVRLHARKTK